MGAPTAPPSKGDGLTSVAWEGTIRFNMSAKAGRRNHDCVVHDGRLVNVFGRWARTVEEIYLPQLLGGQPAAWWSAWLHSKLGANKTGKEVRPQQGLANCNHIVAVPLQVGAGETELWLPCGFEGDRVGKEESTRVTRIVNLTTLEVRKGPRIAQAGGACAALALPVGRQGEESLQVCAIGGTDGTHNSGRFLDSMRCFSRASGEWHEPAQRLPFALDHANAVLIPAGTCARGDPPRVLLMNFRTQHYSNERTEILALDLGEAAGSRTAGAGAAMRGASHRRIGARARRGMRAPWYLYANDSNSLPRDAGGIVLAAGGRAVLNFGGVYYAQTESKAAAAAFFDRELKGRLAGVEVARPKSPHSLRVSRGADYKGTRWQTRLIFSEVRAFDVCTSRRWFPIAQLEFGRHALQSCASGSHTFTCGGFGRNGRCDGLKENCRSCDVHSKPQLEKAALAAFDAHRHREERARRRRLAEEDGGASATAAAVSVPTTVQGRVLARFGF